MSLEGKYVLESSEKFDEFLKAIGVGWMMRKAASIQTPTVEIKQDADSGEWTIKTVTTFKTSEMKFKIDEEFEEDRLDGKKVKSTIRKDGDKLVQDQQGETPCEIVREIDNDKLKTTCKAGEGDNAVVSVRIYKRV